METENTKKLAIAESTKAVAEAEGQKLLQEMIQRAQMECDARLVQVKQEIESKIIMSEAKLKAAESQAEIINEEANVEEQNGKNLADLRKYEYDFERIKVFKTLAQNAKMVISGDTGESLLQQVCPGSKMDMAIHPLPVTK